MRLHRRSEFGGVTQAPRPSISYGRSRHCPNHRRSAASAVIAASASATAGPDCRSAIAATRRAAHFASCSAADLSVATAAELSIRAAADIAVRAATEFGAAPSHVARLTRPYGGAAHPAAIPELLTSVAEFTIAEITIADTDAIFAGETVAITEASTAETVVGQAESYGGVAAAIVVIVRIGSVVVLIGISAISIGAISRCNVR